MSDPRSLHCSAGRVGSSHSFRAARARPADSERPIGISETTACNALSYVLHQRKSWHIRSRRRAPPPGHQGFPTQPGNRSVSPASPPHVGASLVSPNALFPCSDLSNAFFRIDGRVTDRKTFLGVPGLRVEAWDARAERKEPLATTSTQRDGTFHFDFGEASLVAWFRGRDLDLVFRVLDGAKQMFRGVAPGTLAQRTVAVAIEADGWTATEAPTRPGRIA